MKNTILLSICLLLLGSVYAQNKEHKSSEYASATDLMMHSDRKLTIGGYGEVHFNQGLNSGIRENAKLDVHRMVMLFGYKFNKRTQFITELEFEHVKEVYVEQAFLQYQINSFINLRAGLLLTPMGIINEYHEPTAFNGVERPLVDKYIAPTTWREIGFGFSGNYLPAKLKYQVYLVNGFSSFTDGSAKLNGKYGLRKGRQKGAESFMSSPNYTAKVEYYGIRGLNLGVSGYYGKTQSSLFNNLDKEKPMLETIADSSVVKVAMLGVDARYSLKGMKLRGQFYYTDLGNTEAYNQLTQKDGKLNDLGSSMIGYYVEAAYNVLRFVDTEQELAPFVRYSFLNTQNTVAADVIKNPKYEKNIITAGLTYALAKGAVLKADMQFIEDGNGEKTKTINLGMGILF